jgi:two-component system chemotaxis response regulator CheY
MKILIVDDSKAMRMIVRRSITQAGFTHFETIEADSGASALQMIEKESPDIVLSDWNMPEMKGIDLLKALRAAGRTVPLGFITSESSPEIHRQAQESGAAFVIVKPFTPAAIELALKPLIA